MTTPEKLFDLLHELHMETKTVSHKPLFTVRDSEEVTRDLPGGHTKNLFVKDRKGNYFLIVAEQQTRIDMNRIHPLIGAKRLSFATAEDLRRLLMVEPGSVTAFAAMNDKQGAVQVVVDAALLRHERINCHPLTNTMTTTISRQDLLRFLEHVDHRPLIVTLSQEAEARSGTEYTQ